MCSYGRRRRRIERRDTDSPQGQQTGTTQNTVLDDEAINRFRRSGDNAIYPTGGAEVYSLFPGDIVYTYKPTAASARRTHAGIDKRVMNVLNGLPGDATDDPLLNILQAMRDISFYGVADGSTIRFTELPSVENVSTAVMLRGLTTITNTGDRTIKEGDDVYMGFPSIHNPDLIHANQGRGKPRNRITPTVYSHPRYPPGDNGSNKIKSITIIMTSARTVGIILDSWSRISQNPIYKYSGGTFADNATETGARVLARDTNDSVKVIDKIPKLSGVVAFTQSMIKFGMIMGLRLRMFEVDAGIKVGDTADQVASGIKNFMTGGMANNDDDDDDGNGDERSELDTHIKYYTNMFGLDSDFKGISVGDVAAPAKLPTDTIMKVGQYMFATTGFPESTGAESWKKVYANEGDKYSPYLNNKTGQLNKQGSYFSRMGALSSRILNEMFETFRQAHKEERSKYVGKAVTEGTPGNDFTILVKG